MAPKTIYEGPLVHPTPTALESAVRGGGQGASLGFVDEASGGIVAALQSMFPDKFPSAGKSFGERYKDAVSGIRVRDAAAEEANPTLYKGAKLAGNLATSAMAIPSVPISSGSITPAASLLNATMAGGALGGVNTAGEANLDYTQGGGSRENRQAAGDVRRGIATGAMAGTAGQVARELAQAGAWGTSSAEAPIRRAIDTFLNEMPGGGKYAYLLQRALAQGPDSARAVYYALSKSDPEFQTVVQKYSQAQQRSMEQDLGRRQAHERGVAQGGLDYIEKHRGEFKSDEIPRLEEIIRGEDATAVVQEDRRFF